MIPGRRTVWATTAAGFAAVVGGACLGSAQGAARGTIVGSVFYGGRPVRVAEVQVVSLDTSRHYFTFAAFSGNWTVSGLPAGSYIVRISPAPGEQASTLKGAADCYRAAGSSTCTVIELDAGQKLQTERVDLAAGGAVSGTLRDARDVFTAEFGATVYTTAGTPVSHVQPLYSRRFSVAGLPPGRYKVGFSPWNRRPATAAQRPFAIPFFYGGSTFRDAAPITVRDGQTTKLGSVTLEAAKRAPQLSGKVLFATGRVVGRPRVTAFDSHDQPVGSVIGENDGTWAFTALRLGTYKVRISGDGTTSASRTVRLRRNHSKTRLTVTLRRSTVPALAKP